jgi:hypothetical protein
MYLGETTNVKEILVRKPEGKRQLEDKGTDSKIILKWNVWESVNLIHLAQAMDRYRPLLTL